MTKGISCLLNRFAILFALLFTIGVGQMWGTARKFKTGERIYFEDAAVISGSCMKYSDDKLWAVFGGKGNWIESQIQSGSWNTAGTIYYFDVPQFEGNDYEFDYVIFTRNGWGIQTYNENPDEYYNYFKLTGYDNNKHVSGEWKKYSVNPMLIGSMNDWNPDASGYTFGDYDGSVCRLIVDLPADETYDFQILHGTGWYSYDNNKSGWTITNTTHESWQTLYSGNQNAHITTGEAGTYIFRYNDSDHTFAAYYPQARFAKQTVLYFDATDNTDWNDKTYTSKWYFKYWDSGNDYDALNPEVCNTPVENYKYYVTIPNNDWLGRVQVDRYDGSRQGGSDVAMAYNRTASTQNCVKAASGSSTSVTWTTYCPPTTSETFADNSTTKISWQPNTNDGSTSGKAIWVKTGTTLEVTASASKAVADDNMTIKYDFKVDGSSQQNTTTATYTHSASTNNTTYELSADIYTNYNLDNTKNSTKHTQSSIFYKALDTYSVTHTLSGVTKASGREGDDAAAYYVAYDATYTANTGYYLPSDVTVTIGGVTKTKGTDYTWTVTDGTSGALSILANKISGNVVVTINGVWRWSIAIDYAAEYAAWNCDAYPMGNFTTSSGDDFCSINISLPANTDYNFKVVDRNGYVWNGVPSGADEVYLTYTSGNGDATALDAETGNTNIHIHTAGAGTYTFTYNITDHTLTVTYPTSYTVTYDDNGSTGGTVPTDNDYYAANATVTVKGNGGSLTKTGYNTLAYWNTKNDGSGTDIAISTGTFSITDNTTLYAKWTPAILTFTGATDSDWNTTANWSPACVPTINHDVVLNVPVEVNIDHAVAKSIVIDQNEHTGSLTIQANKGLEVAGTISKTMDGSSYGPTTPADLVLESSASGNATLIFDNSNSDQATVQMYSKGWTTGTQGSGTWNWQTVGVPVIDATRINDYYNGYMYEWNTSTRTWDDVTDTEALLTEFKAYSVTYPTTSDNLHTYSIDGTLAATTNQTINVAAGQTVQAAANSWTAPIRINNITSTNWSPATIFLYNTGYNPDVDNKADKSGERYAAGKYLPIPVSSAPYLGESYIAPMQGFFFKNTKSASAGTITLSYADAVRPDGSKEIVAGEMHAPKRAMAAEPVVMKIYVSDSLYDDRVVLLARNDFSRGFDNGWDGEKFQVNAVTTAPRLFAINETGGKEEVSAIPELENTVIGFRPGTEESYTIHFDYNGDETLYLRDTRTGAETLITNESKYIFLSDGTNEDARFIISRVQSTPTGTEEIGAGSKAYKLMIEDHIYIIRDGRMYSVDGALVK